MGTETSNPENAAARDIGSAGAAPSSSPDVPGHAGGSRRPWAEPAPDRPALWMPYAQMKTAARPLEVAATEGCRLTLADGRVLIDGVASWWTACHGYRHPHIVQAVEDQLACLPHVMLGGLVHHQVTRLADRLAAITPGDLGHVFFSESGSVSVEVAMKIAIQYWRNSGVSGKTRFLSFTGGYHGDTMATMAVCDPEEGMHSLFTGVLPEQVVVDLPRDEASTERFEAAIAAHAHELAAVTVEPLVQGAGGMVIYPPAVLSRIAEACRRHHVLLICDEIFTGFARTGTLFACAQAGVVPDLMTVSKSLTGGVCPLAATIARRPVFEAFWDDDPDKALMHGPTYSGHALGCAAANASLDLFETEPRLEQVARIEAQLTEGLAPLRRHARVADIRIKGAIGAVELDPMPDSRALTAAFVEEGVWLRSFRNIVYTTPPLTIGEGDLGRLMTAMDRVIAAA